MCILFPPASPHTLSSVYWSVLNRYGWCYTQTLSDPITQGYQAPLSRLQCAFISKDLPMGFLFQFLSLGSGAPLLRSTWGFPSSWVILSQWWMGRKCESQLSYFRTNSSVVELTWQGMGVGAEGIFHGNLPEKIPLLTSSLSLISLFYALTHPHFPPLLEALPYCVSPLRVCFWGPGPRPELLSGKSPALYLTLFFFFSVFNKDCLYFLGLYYYIKTMYKITHKINHKSL